MCNIVVDAVRKEFEGGSYVNAFVQVDYDFPVEGDAKVALSILCEGHLDSICGEIRHLTKSHVRKLLKEWDARIGKMVRAY